MTCAEALPLHEKLLMTHNDTALELYHRGISAHKLRRSYVEDRLDDYPFASETRQELMDRTEEDSVWASLFLHDTLSILDRVESQVIDGLLSGDIVALGYDDPHDPTIRSVPPYQWNFLKLDFDKSIAIGTDLHYVGLRFIRNCELTDQQLSALQRQQPYRKAGQPAKDKNIVSFDLQAKDWAEVGFRFLKDSLVAVRIQNKEQHITLGALGLINNTTGAPNIACVTLLKLANGQWVSSEEKHVVSGLRRQLKQMFGLSSDPFHIEQGRGYVPKFQLIDNRDALDRRAEDKAMHVSFSDEWQREGEMSDGRVRPETIDY